MLLSKNCDSRPPKQRRRCKRPAAATMPKAASDVPDGYRLVPADGNYAWVVAAGCFFCGILSSAPMLTFSVLIDDMKVAFDVNTETVSWAASVFLMFNFMLGPVNTIIIKAIGCRKTVLFGCFMITGGLMASCLCRRIELLCVTFGAIAGFGTGICHACYPVILSRYFARNYGIAIGILVACYPASRLINVPLVMFLRGAYGFPTVLFLMGAASLHICVFASLFQPAKWHMRLVPNHDQQEESTKNDPPTEEQPFKTVELSIRDKDINENGNDLSDKKASPMCSLGRLHINVQNLSRNSSVHSFHMASNWDIFGSAVITNLAAADDDGGSENEETDTDTEAKADHSSVNVESQVDLTPSKWRHRMCSAIDFTLLKEPLFYVVCINGSLVLGIMMFSNIYLFPMCIEMGMNAVQTASIISAKAVADMVSRISCPYLVLLLGLSNRHVYILLSVLHGLILLAVQTATTFEKFFAWAVASGATFGATTSLSALLILKTLGAQRLSSVIGLSTVVHGILIAPMAPAMGRLRDTTGSYVYVFFVTAAFQFLLSAVWIVKPYCSPKKSSAST